MKYSILDSRQLANRQNCARCERHKNDHITVQEPLIAGFFMSSDIRYHLDDQESLACPPKEETDLGYLEDVLFD